MFVLRLIRPVILIISLYSTVVGAAQPPPALDPAALVGRITYAHDDEIYVMNADGTEPTRLTTSHHSVRGH